MASRESDLDRLLRAAAENREPAADAPFGFDTRIVGLWRASRAEGAAGARELARLVRRIVAVAAIVTVFSGIGAYWEVSANEDAAEPSTNAYAIADTAIESGLFQ
jgi:hypothetical protein